MPLPLAAHLPAIQAALREHGAVVLEAPPGTGKTTLVPPALRELTDGEIHVLEPRRIAARTAAARVAADLGEPLGETVGYAMRFDRRAGPRTRVLYVTEALLTRRLAEDPRLEGIGAVVLDEFHERSVHTDVALAWVRALRRERPELKLVVMSATFDGAPLAAWLGCPRIRVEGALHPVDVEYYARPDERPVEVKVATALEVTDGDVLVFLPGVGEIERCRDHLRLDADVLPLHGELDADAQDRALRAGPRRRVILATNVAETSITVEGVHTVLDTGTARIAGHDPWTGLSTLALEPISRASAAQRAGRAGRLGPGRCLRLYTRADHDARTADTPPEIRRIDLAATVLDLGARTLEWYEPPPPAAWNAAVTLLRRLDALGNARGARMARMPVAPRVARVLVEPVPEEAAALASLFGGRRRGVVDLVDLATAGERREREARQIARHVQVTPGASLSRALLAGFPDRVGHRRGSTVVLAEGGSAALDAATPGEDGFVVVTEAERVNGRVFVRSMTAIPADWLLDGAEVCETLTWTGGRVEAREQLRYGALVLEDGPGRGDPEAVAALLRQNVVPQRDFADHDAALALVNRVAYLRRVGIELEPLTIDDLVAAACAGRRALAELDRLVGRVDPRVDALAPTHIPVGGRARAPVTYPADADPYVSSRMQDFFGLRESPRIAGGRPLVLHLCAPNGRPVQVTSDLAGFWERHWPAIRKELMRRYPRHRWPERPDRDES